MANPPTPGQPATKRVVIRKAPTHIVIDGAGREHPIHATEVFLDLPVVSRAPGKARVQMPDGSFLDVPE